MFKYIFYKEGIETPSRPEPHNPYIDASTACLFISSQRLSDIPRKELYEIVARDYRKAKEKDTPFNLRERILLP